MRAAKIPGWPAEADPYGWEDDRTIKIYTDRQLAIDVGDHSVSTPHDLVLPSILQNADEYSYAYSPHRNYLLKCTGKDQDNEYHSLQMYRVADEQLIGQTDNLDFWCLWGIRWAPDESALSFATKSANYGNTPLGTNIYIWRVDGTAPYLIGDGSFLDEPGNWSPDSKRLAVEIENSNPASVSETTYEILYLDGRPPLTINAELGDRAMHGVDWVTNKIFEELNTCCGMCVFLDYYEAESGKNISDLHWYDCSSWYEIPNQNPIASPDERWFILDKTDHDNWGIQEKGWKQTLAYVLYDLQAYQPYTVSATSDLYLDFTGWANDSSTFYLVRRPITDTVVEQPDTPFGLLALNPNTRQFKLLNPSIRYAWLSPDKQHIFGYSQQGQGFSAAMYNLDGSLLTTHQPVSNTSSRYFELGEVGELRIAWSNNGTQAVFNDMWGNLWLVNINGSVYQLASGFPLPDQNHFYHDLFYWSPDDLHLLVQANDQAWVVYLPKSLPPGAPITLSSLRMIDESAGWGIDTNGNLMRTTDGGLTWRNASPSAQVYAPGSLLALDANTAWVSPSQGSTSGWLTSDGGLTWLPDQPVPNGALASTTSDGIEWLNPLAGWRLRQNSAGSYDLEQSRDGGQTWTKIKTVLWNGQLDFVSEQVGWAIAHLGEETALLKTTDGGQTWVEIKPVATP